MPIPAAADGEGVTNTVLTLFRQLHNELRNEVNKLDASALNWVPTSGANSITTIVTHLLGSEAETLQSLAGLSCERDRDAEFGGEGLSAGQVLAMLDEADDLIAAVEPRIGEERLDSTFGLPTLAEVEIRTGLTWLVGNYGHAREHLGHIQLTSQLYEGQRSADSGHL